MEHTAVFEISVMLLPLLLLPLACGKGDHYDGMLLLQCYTIVEVIFVQIHKYLIHTLITCKFMPRFQCIFDLALRASSLKSSVCCIA